MTESTAADEIVYAINDVIIDVRKVGDSLERQICGSAHSSDRHNPQATGSAVGVLQRINKMIAELEAMYSSDDTSADQDEDERRASLFSGPGAEVYARLCCRVNGETTSREAAASDDSPAVDVDPRPVMLASMAAVHWIEVRGCTDFSSPDPTAAENFSCTSIAPSLRTSPSMHTDPPLWTAPLVYADQPEHAELIDRRTARTATQTTDNRPKDTDLHVQVTATEPERHYPPAKAAPLEQATTLTFRSQVQVTGTRTVSQQTADPAMQDASEDVAEGTGSTTEDRIPVDAGRIKGWESAGAGCTTEDEAAGEDNSACTDTTEDNGTKARLGSQRPGGRSAAM